MILLLRYYTSIIIISVFSWKDNLLIRQMDAESDGDTLQPCMLGKYSGSVRACCSS